MKDEDSDAADIGGIAIAEVLHLLRLFVLAHDEKKQPKTPSRIGRR